MPDDCAFCHHLAPESILYRWTSPLSGAIYVVRPLNPVTEGHVLVVPERHVTDFTSSPRLSALVMDTAASWAREEMGDCNLITSAGPYATQTVFHLHVHLVPRRAGDGLCLPWDCRSSIRSEM